MPQRILIVDDEVLMHLLYRKHLERAGYQLLGAKDGKEAIEIATREQPRAIVMDVFMQGMDGLAAVRAMKKSEATKGIPVIIITAQVGAHHATRQEAERAGAALFLPKPFSPSQLLTALEQVTAKPPAAEQKPTAPPPG